MHPNAVNEGGIAVHPINHEIQAAYPSEADTSKGGIISYNEFICNRQNCCRVGFLVHLSSFASFLYSVGLKLTVWNNIAHKVATCDGGKDVDSTVDGTQTSIQVLSV